MLGGPDGHKPAQASHKSGAHGEGGRTSYDWQKCPPLQEKPRTHVQGISLKRTVKRTPFPMATHRHQRFYEQQQRNEWLQQNSYKERTWIDHTHLIKLSPKEQLSSLQPPPTPPPLPFLSEKGSPGNPYKCVTHSAGWKTSLPAWPLPAILPKFPTPTLRPRRLPIQRCSPCTAREAAPTLPPGLLQRVGRGGAGKVHPATRLK